MVSKPGKCLGVATALTRSMKYTPKIFSLTAGQHTLVIRGRENTTLIDKISITQTSQAVPPSNVNVVSSR